VSIRAIIRRPWLGRLAAVALAVTALAAAGPALAAKKSVLRLEVASPAPPLADDVAWLATTGDVELSAPAHPLSPVLTPDAMTVQIPGAGPLRVHALGAGQLSRGETLVVGVSEDAPLVATFHETWTAVDERYTLTPDGVEHDLLVHEAAAASLGGQPLRASWLLDLPAGATVALEPAAGAVIRAADGRFLARVPEPVVSDASNPHRLAGIAHLELQPVGDDAVLEVVVSADWVGSPDRAFPIVIDPTISLQPLDGSRVGFVTELGLRVDDDIVSGTLALLGYGSQVRGFAEFDTSAIPDGATITSVHLLCWTANHDNPPTPAPITELAIQQVLTPVDIAPLDLHAAIGPLYGGVPYFVTALASTGADFCPEAFVFRDYDLGAQGATDLQSELTGDFFTVGFVSSTAADPLFQHVDYIGYTEYVAGLFCAGPTPGARMTLAVEYEADSTCHPQNHGYWHRYCLGADAIDPGRHGRGNGPGPQGRQADLPAGLLAAADAAMAPHGLTACQALDEGPLSDPLLAALRELATIHLNLAAGLLQRSCPVELRPVEDADDLVVADAIALMEARIADGSVDALHEARWIGEHVVTREALVDQ